MPTPSTRLDTLAARLRAHGAEVFTTSPGDLSPTIIGLIGQRGWHRLVSVRRNRVGHPSVLGDDPPLDDAEIARLDAVITETAGAAAEIGAVVLDHSRGQARRSLMSIPDILLCVVESEAVRDTPAELAATTETEPSWVSGPDAPADLVPGVHRPRQLIVVLVG